MAGAIPITRNKITPAQLRTAAGRAKDGRVARRMLAIALVLEGADRKSAAETCGMDRRTLRDLCPAGYAQHAREKGCIATTPRGLRGWKTGAAAVAGYGSRRRRRRNWRPGSRPGLTRREMA